MSLTAAVWSQFATQVFRGGMGRLTCIGSYVNKQVTTFTFLAQATTCSKHHTRTVMDAGCERAPWVRSANPSDSWALVFVHFSACTTIHTIKYINTLNVIFSQSLVLLLNTICAINWHYQTVNLPGYSDSCLVKVTFILLSDWSSLSYSKLKSNTHCRLPKCSVLYHFLRISTDKNSWGLNFVWMLESV